MAEYSQPIRKSPRSGQKIDKAEWGGPEWIASLSRPSDRGDIATWPHRAANQGAGEWVLERWKAGEVRANQGVGPLQLPDVLYPTPEYNTTRRM